MLKSIIIPIENDKNIPRSLNKKTYIDYKFKIIRFIDGCVFENKDIKLKSTV